MTEKNAAVNFDDGKTPWALIPLDAVDYVGQVLLQACTRKEKPYPKRNWELGMGYERVFGSLMRHARDFQAGHRTDPQSGLPVMAHLAFRALQLLTYQIRGIGQDDMPSLVAQPESHKLPSHYRQGDYIKFGEGHVHIGKLLRHAVTGRGAGTETDLKQAWLVQLPGGTTCYVSELSFESAPQDGPDGLLK